MFLTLPIRATEPLKIGVLAFRPKVQVLAQWNPLAQYLQQQLETNVTLTAYGYLELKSAILNDDLDIVMTNPAHYISLRHNNHLSAPLVMQITKNNGYELTTFGGVIFTKKTSLVTKLADINQYSIAVTKQESLGGYQMQAYELFSAGLSLPKEQHLLITGMPHDNVVNAVLSEKAEVGFVRSGVLESLHSEGKIDIANIRILNQQKTAGFPLIKSTPLYPEWPVAITQNVDNYLARQITIALLALQPENEAAIKAGIHGFTIPSTYSAVEDLLRELRVKPFDVIPPVSVFEFWQQHMKGLVIVIGLALSLIILGFGIFVQNRFIKKNERYLLSVQDDLKSTLNAVPDSMFEVGLDGTYYHVWSSHSHLLAAAEKDMLGKRISEVLDHESATICLAALQEANVNKFSSGHKIKLILNDEEMWFELSVEKKELSYEGQPVFIVLSQNITERIKSDERLKLVSCVFSDIQESVSITDAQGIIIDVNTAYCKTTGYSREEVIGQNPRILKSNKQSPEFYIAMWQQINDVGFWQGELWNRTKNGNIYASLLSITSLKNEQGVVTHFIGVSTDVTKSKQQEEKLNLMAHYDVLTGLPNRALFIDRFHQAIAHSKRTEMQLAVCFLDLDKFKPVNDLYGHDVGDQLLIEVAQRIQSCLREEDTVSRQGGDEFALLLSDIRSIKQIEVTLDRLHYLLSRPYNINGVTHTITLSTGVTIYPIDNGDIDTLLRHADNAMYQAKQTGRNRYHLFSIEQDHEIAKKNHRIDEISQALLKKEFELYYQPKVNMLTGEVFGVEALIRWIHPKKGIISPLSFLPYIEGTELEINIGNWVIDSALCQLEHWAKLGIKVEVSVNIASEHMLSNSFLLSVKAALAKYSSVDSKLLQLEILESSALGDLNSISEVIKSCQKEFGIKVALDDFGTGYSSLTHLRNLPVNIIKIDESFVRDMLDDPSDFAIIDGVLGLSDAFNREIIAEGVETTKHGLMLLLMGCVEAQGYSIAKPMSADSFPRWLKSYVPDQAWLQFAHKQTTQKDKKIQLFSLIIEQWKEMFINNVWSSLEDSERWPIMNSEHCFCGEQINRIKQDKLLAPEDFKNLAQFHELLHINAQKLYQQYIDGDIEKARDGLVEFQATFDRIKPLLQKYSSLFEIDNLAEQQHD